MKGNLAGHVHKLTKADNRKGGKSRSKRKAIANSLKNRKYCNTRCPLFPCFAEPLSHEKYSGECALKKFPYNLQKKVIDLFLKGEQGMNTQIMHMLIEVSKGFDKSTWSDQRRIMYDWASMKKAIYGDKSRVEATVNPMDEVVKALKLKPEE